MESFSERDKHYMSAALRLAERGRYTVGVNPMVACVIVRDDTIVGEDYHRRSGEAHAEVLALRKAAAAARAATVYVTLEPCVHHGKPPPCVPALIAAKVRRVVVAMLDPNPLVHGRGVAALRAAGIQVACGLFEDRARTLNRGFVSRMVRKRPWLRLKSAISLDGRIALASGESAWISSAESRRDVQFWRARSGALLTTSRSVRADNPQLNVRLSAAALGIEGAVRQPLRVVLDTRLSTSPTARIYAPLDTPAAKTIVAVGEQTMSSKRVDEFARRGVELLAVPTVKSSPAKSPIDQSPSGQSPTSQSKLDLAKCLELLAARYHINEVQVEAGGVLFAAIVAANLCDELLLYIAPCLLGAEAKSLAQFDDVIETMQARFNFSYKAVTQIGGDLRILAEPCPH